MKTTVRLLALCGWLAISLPAQDTASIQGVVTSEAGQPVKGAFVGVITEKGERKSASPTGADGGFTLEALPAGAYSLCIQVPGTALLDPCKWPMLPVSVTVGIGQAVKGVQVKLREGATIKVRLSDASGLLAANVGKTPGASVLVGAWTANGLFQPAQLVRKSASEQEYRLVIPYDTSLKLSVHSDFFRLADDKGAPLADFATGVPLEAKSGVAVQPVVFTISGVKQ